MKKRWSNGRLSVTVSTTTQRVRSKPKIKQTGKIFSHRKFKFENSKNKNQGRTPDFYLSINITV